MICRCLAAIATAALLGLTGAACAPSTTTSSPAGITVAAASSLTDVFAQIGADFTAETGIPVSFSFAGSSAIAEQVRGGAPLDVFASAGTSSMDPLVTERLVSDPEAFASNSLVIAVPAGNPGGVASLADLSRVSVVVCQEQVPCGVATVALFERNSITVTPVSFEPDVRSVLTKVSTDEADAGLVYVTDVESARATVEGVPIPPDDNVTTVYQAAVVAESDNAESAARFVAFLATPRAQATLVAAGFGVAP